MWSSSELAGACALAVVLAVSTPAFADPSPADVESAKAQYLEGIALREKGDEAGALVRFKAAFALVPTPITALEVGRSQLALGKILDGRDTLQKAARMPKVAGESAKADEARDEATKLADGAKARLATLAVTPVEGASLVIDGMPIPRDAATVPRVVDPGHHVVELRTNDSEGRTEVDLRDGESGTVTVPMHPSMRPAVKLHPLVFIGFGVGAVGLLTGAATGIGALVTASKLKTDCPNMVCPASSADTIDTSKTLGTVSTIAFIVGGVGVVGGIVGIVLSKREPPTTAWIAPRVGFLSVGIEGGF